MASADGIDPCGEGKVGSAEFPRDIVAVDSVSVAERLPARALCEWCEVVVLEGLDIGGGLVTSWDDCGDDWLEGE